MRSYCRIAVIFFTVALLSACDQPAPKASTSPMSTTQLSLLERGQYLAVAANCAGCHTPLGKQKFSGGRAIATPFGEVISSNLSSDPETGLGKWNSDEFWQALHHGKSRDGRSLYPAFPYPNYSLITRDDSDAIFAYLQSIPAVKHIVPAHRLRFPYDSQWALNIWRSLFFKPMSFTSDITQSKNWNRGVYLVEGLGHCGACHTPRGMLGNYDKDQSLTGTHIDGLDWDAPSIVHGTLSATQQTQMIKLLKTGINERDVMSGPMAEVVRHSLQYLKSEDIAAMVEYLSSLPGKAETIENDNLPTSDSNLLGLEVYKEHCSDCHGMNGQGEPYRYPALAGNRGVNTASPRNAIHSLMFGGFGASTAGRPRPYGMPAFAKQLSDKEAAAVLTYIRSTWGNNAAAVKSSSIWQQ